MITPDTSVVVAALAPWHDAQAAARAALASGPVRLVAHVAYEATSVLSRMPEGHRVASEVVLGAITRSFPDPWLALDGPGARAALERAVAAGVRGGALYDALIAATAVAHEMRIVSADRRALATYDALGVDVTLLEA